MIFSEAVIALTFYLVFSSFVFIGLPLTKRFFSSTVVAFNMAKLVGFILFSYVIWLAASLHLIDYQNLSLITIVWLVGLAVGLVLLRPWDNFREKFGSFSQYRGVIYLEIFLLLLYFSYLFLRTYNPAIYGTERFMDMMLFQSSAKTHYFPFIDGWHAGATVNYYYYGSYLFSLLARLSRSPLALAYNFSLGLLFVQVCANSSLFVYEFTKKKTYAVLGSFLVVLSGSTFYAGCVASGWLASPSTTCSYASSTRFFSPSYIINEIPSYSFTVGDLHAHVVGLMLFIGNLFLLAVLAKKKKPDWLIFGFLIVGMASSAMTNAWDFITLASVLGLIVVVKIYTDEFRKSGVKDFGWLIGPAGQWLGAGVGCLILALSAMLPFIVNFHSPVLGLGFVPSFVAAHNLQNVQWPTPLSAELGLWGLLLLGCAMCFWVIKKSVSNSWLPAILIITSLGIILGVEIFFIPDIYSVANPPYFRANTVFKFGYHAWTMLGLAFCLLLYEARNLPAPEKKKERVRYKPSMLIKLLPWLVALMVVAGIIYPFQAIEQFYLAGTPKEQYHSSLDGSLLMKNEGAGDYETVQYINQNIHDRAVILEAAGDSYKYFGRISVFTGMIDPVNWLTHEWTWRLDAKAAKAAKPGQSVETGYGPIAGISQDVQSIYNTTDPVVASNLLKKYGVQYVYIGTLEHSTYQNLSPDKFYKLGQVIYSTSTSQLIKIN